MNRVHNWLVLLFIFSIPVSSYISIKLLIACFVLSFLVRPSALRVRDILFRSWDLLFYFVVLIVGIFYSADTKTAFSVLETSASLALMPIVFGSIPDFDNNKMNKIFSAFIAGCLAACVISVGSSFIEYNKSGDVNSFFFYKLTESIHSHPTYFAYYIIFSLTITLYLLYYRLTEYSKLLLILIVLFFFTILIFTGGRTALMSLLFIFSFFILKSILEERSANVWLVLVLVSCMVISLFLVNSIPALQQLFLQGDYWERSTLWQAALEANPNPLLGVGTGDYKDVLNEYYRSHNLLEFAEGSFNSHNQFTQIYLSNGLLGFAALAILIGRPLYFAVRDQSAISILFFFPLIIYGMNEAFLGRYQGVVFVALLHELIMRRYHAGGSSSLHPPNFK